MKRETAAFLRQAEACIRRADTMLKVDVVEDAARTAYLACFHVAQAFVFEATGKTSKTHRGLQIEFFRLTKDDSRVVPELRRFLSQAYEFKTAADYFVGENEKIAADEAREAVETAKRFTMDFSKLMTSAARD